MDRAGIENHTSFCFLFSYWNASLHYAGTFEIYTHMSNLRLSSVKWWQWYACTLIICTGHIFMKSQHSLVWKNTLWKLTCCSIWCKHNVIHQYVQVQKMYINNCTKCDCTLFKIWWLNTHDYNIWTQLLDVC